MSTNVKNLLTLVGGALVTIGPQLVSAAPAQYRDAASAILALAVSAWHLYQPSPTANTVSPKDLTETK